MNQKLSTPLLTVLFIASLSFQINADEFDSNIEYINYQQDGTYDSSGNWWDYSSAKDSLAESGISFSGNMTQIYQGVTSGGLDRSFKYGGHADYMLNFDLGKMGVQEGLFLKMRAETQIGEGLGTRTGAILPSGLVTQLPVANDHTTALTSFMFTQMLSPTFGIFAGKTDTLDGDVNAFAHGRGKTQFMNSALIFNPIAVRTIPYSALAAGFVFLNEGEPLFTFTLINPEDTATTSGFNSLFADGIAIAAELRIPVQIMGLPGHQLFAGSWNNREFNSLNQDPRILLPPLNVPIQEKSGSWSIYYNFDQYLVVDPSDSSRGWGIFGRAGISDGNPNPMEYFLSFGVGGSSPISCRENDNFGIGWFYNGASDELGPIASQILSDGQGVELFYNIAVTEKFYLTPDLQFIDGGIQATDGTAVVLGLRANLVL